MRIYSIPSPTNPILQQRLDEISQHEAATAEDLAVQRENILNQQYDQPHTQALSSLEARLSEEADKIKNRNPELQKE